MSDPRPIIAVLGGTGKEGSGLAFRWAHAGYPVILGSRTEERAVAAAEELNRLLAGRAVVSGRLNLEAARAAAIVVLTVPWAAQLPTAFEVKDALAGKVFIDVTVPLVPPKVDRVQLPEGGSAVLRLQRELGDRVRVVSAFQNVSAVHLKDLDHAIDCDVLVCGDDAAAREQAVELAEAAGMVAWHAGALANSAASEALTSVLIAINKRYKVSASGLRITGVRRPDAVADAGRGVAERPALS
ncbi:MAG: NADPH-dependent F420 reductase [Pseudomonadota bacterium]|nr:NADPH-dependent F420 reductase [Pseudomonadota bacterium]